MDAGQFRTQIGAKPTPRVAALDKRLGLRKRGRDDGARNQPRPDAIDLSEAEQQIVAVVGAERAAVDSERTHAKAEAEQRLRALAPTAQDFAAPALEARIALKQAAGRL